MSKIIPTQNLEKSVGVIAPPPGVDKQIAAAGMTGSNNIAIFYFISNLLKIGLALMGIWVLFNFVLAGYSYITGGGESKAAEEVKTKLTMSFIGLVLIVAAYTIVAVLSLVLFGDAGFILNPQIEGPK